MSGPVEVRFDASIFLCPAVSLGLIDCGLMISRAVGCERGILEKVSDSVRVQIMGWQKLQKLITKKRHRCTSQFRLGVCMIFGTYSESSSLKRIGTLVYLVIVVAKYYINNDKDLENVNNNLVF